LSYLIDTNVLSELRRKEPNPGVVAWFEERPATTLYVSVLTLGEIRKGIEALGQGKRKPQAAGLARNRVAGIFLRADSAHR